MLPTGIAPMAARWKTKGMSDVMEISISDGTIRLGQLLKLAGAVENGVIAREVIAAGAVEVDGTVEDRRGAQIKPGQTVVFHGDEVGLPDATLRVVAED